MHCGERRQGARRLAGRDDSIARFTHGDEHAAIDTLGQGGAIFSRPPPSTTRLGVVANHYEIYAQALGVFDNFIDGIAVRQVALRFDTACSQPVNTLLQRRLVLRLEIDDALDTDHTGRHKGLGMIAGVERQHVDLGFEQDREFAAALQGSQSCR